jgi:hypothetical protein
MEDNEPSLAKTVSSWIVSLAISVLCCAVLFVVFAQYVVDIKRNIAAENQRLEIMTIQQDELLAQIKSLHKIMAASIAPVATPAVPAPVGVAVQAPAPAEIVQPATPAPAAPATPEPATVAPAPVPTSGTDAVATPPAAPPAPPADLPPVNVPTIPSKP